MTFRKVSLLATFTLAFAAAYFAFTLSAQAPAGEGKGKQGAPRLYNTAKQKILGGWSPFTGPIMDQSGKMQVPDGQAATADQLSSLSYLVKGVVGTLPKSS